MDYQELTAVVKMIIQNEANVSTDNLQPDTQLVTLEIDSLDMMKIAAALEKEFRITIATAELIEIRTLRDIVDGLERKIDLTNPSQRG